MEQYQFQCLIAAILTAGWLAQPAEIDDFSRRSDVIDAYHDFREALFPTAQ